MLSIKELLKKTGLWAVFILISAILTISFGFILNYFKLNENVAIGIPAILMFYFWGGYFLRKHGWSKVLGIVLFIAAIALNFVFISSPYDTANEFKATRVFLPLPLLASIFLILRKGKFSRLMGVLVITLTLLSAFLGAVFCSSCQTPQPKSEAPNSKTSSTKTPNSTTSPMAYTISIHTTSTSDPNVVTTKRYRCSSPSYDNNQAETLAPNASLLQKLNNEVVQLNDMAAQLNEMGSQNSINNYNAMADDYNMLEATYKADKKQYDSEWQAYEDYIKAHCTYVGN
ncbi:MAG: hypothetical protein Q8L01_02065 [Candidatus Woesebacteria bacterium]|nr:hypothetical protein [Candidatus Woesebacteria bacterium]